MSFLTIAATAWRPAQTQVAGQPWSYEGGPSPPPFPPGVAFAGSFSDYTVLQKGVAAAVHGVVTDPAAAAATVTVSVAEAGAPAYNVTAEVVTLGSGAASWKALLHPHATQGGDLTVTAACVGCANGTTATLRHLTYGDVWFCAGQSSASTTD